VDENGYLDPLLFLPPRDAGSPPPEPAPAAETTEPPGTGALQPPLEVDAAPPQVETPSDSPSPTAGTPEDDLGEPAVRPPTAEPPVEAEPSSAADADDPMLPVAAPAASTDAPSSVATDPERGPADPPADGGVMDTGSTTTDANAATGGDSAGRGAGAVADARAGSEAPPTPAPTPTPAAEREVRAAVATGRPGAAERGDPPKRRTRPDHGPRLEPAALSVPAGDVKAEDIATLVAVETASTGLAAATAHGVTAELESRPGVVGLWPWIPASCVAGVLLGAALALRRRGSTPGEPASSPGAPACTDPPPDEIGGDRLSEEDRLALERELEAILAVSAGARAPLEGLVTDRGTARSPS